MKKALTLLLTLVMCLSLVACGNGEKNDNREVETPANEVPVADTENADANESTSSRDTILASAEMAEYFYELNNITLENRAKAQLTYCDTPVLMYGPVYSIEADCVIMAYSQDVSIKAELPIEDLAQLSTGDSVVLGGILNEAEQGTSSFGLPTYQYTMTSAYLYDYKVDAAEHFYTRGLAFYEEGNYTKAFEFIYPLRNTVDCSDLLFEMVCESYYTGTDREIWEKLFDVTTAVPLTDGEIQEIIVGNWYSSPTAYSAYTEDGKYSYNSGAGDSGVENFWKIERGRIIVDSKYTHSEKIVYPFYKNVYVICAPRDANKVTSDVYSLVFLNGPLE